MEAASSSSGSSSDEDDVVVAMKPIRSLDDLPSDDSVSIDSSDDEAHDRHNDNGSDDTGSSEGDNSNEDGSMDEDAENHENLRDVPLEERVRQRREAGISHRARVDARERKINALQIAGERLTAVPNNSSTAANKRRKASMRRRKHRRNDRIISSEVLRNSTRLVSASRLARIDTSPEIHVFQAVSILVRSMTIMPLYKSCVTKRLCPSRNKLLFGTCQDEKDKRLDANSASIKAV